MKESNLSPLQSDAFVFFGVMGDLAFIPVVGPLARLISLVVAFFAVWLGAAEAHETKGWRTLVFPVVAVLVLIVAVFVVKTLAAGAQFTLSALAAEAGVSAQP